MPLIAAAFIFIAIFLLVVGLAGGKEPDALEARIATLRGDRPSPDALALQPDQSFNGRMLTPLAQSLGVKLQALLPTTWVQKIDKGLENAGEPTTLPGFLVGACISIVTALALGFMLVSTAGMGGSTALLLIMVLAIMGAYLPKMWLGGRVAKRRKAIQLSLPDAFDLITVCVEAGLGLEAALSRVAEKVAGPFGEELTLCLREVSMGKLRREALKEMSDRCGVDDLTGFVNAVIQAEAMGTSIGTVLRVQAEQMRIKRRQRAEQQAHQAPVKMMFPLVLCFLPTLFIVILGPAAINIYHQFVGSNIGQ
jgi:tight adherence protein C